jgi:hypothetical protein
LASSIGDTSVSMSSLCPASLQPPSAEAKRRHERKEGPLTDRSTLLKFASLTSLVHTFTHCLCPSSASLPSPSRPPAEGRTHSVIVTRRSSPFSSKGTSREMCGHSWCVRWYERKLRCAAAAAGAGGGCTCAAAVAAVATAPASASPPAAPASGPCCASAPQP